MIDREIRYYDCVSERHVSLWGSTRYDGSGWTGGVEYPVLYRLDDGRWLAGTRHKDQSDLMTDVAYGRSRSDVWNGPMCRSIVSTQ